MEIETTNTMVSTSETIRTIYQRRAVRKYKDRPVEREKTILAFSKEIAGVIKGADHPFHFSHGLNFPPSEDPIFHGAPVVVFITAARDNEWAPLDIGMCAQNMMLAAKALGMDTCPVGLGKFAAQTEIIARLEVPDSDRVLLSVVLGYGDEVPELHERKSDNIRFID